MFDIKTKAVIIHGNNLVSDSQILETAGIIDYPNFFSVKTKEIEKELKDNSFIEDAKVKRKVFFQLHIYIDENKPLFIREDTDKIVFDNGEEAPNKKNITLDVPSLINY